MTVHGWANRWMKINRGDAEARRTTRFTKSRWGGGVLNFYFYKEFIAGRKAEGRGETSAPPWLRASVVNMPATFYLSSLGKITVPEGASRRRTGSL